MTSVVRLSPVDLVYSHAYVVASTRATTHPRAWKELKEKSGVTILRSHNDFFIYIGFGSTDGKKGGDAW